MEAALRYELINKIPELAPVVTSSGTTTPIYPTNAPEGATKPYLVYYRSNTDITKTLEGYTDKEALSFVFSVMAIKYSDMKSLSNKVKAFLMSIPKTSIGVTKQIFIEDLTINNIDEKWESELGINRGIIDFTIYY